MNTTLYPSCSLVITTYNWPSALNLVLQSVSNQTLSPQQILIADDGSGSDTEQLISSWKDKLPQLTHCWQQDLGFRAAQSRNNALAKVQSDYVILIDGDMILKPHFIEDHLKFSKVGSFVQGRRAKLTPSATEKLLKLDNWQWDAKQLANCVTAAHKLKRNAMLSKFLGYKQHNAKDIRSCNMGFWMDDLKAVNGFDSDYIGWGREDSDLGWRLINNNIAKRHLRYKAVALHLHHKEDSREFLAENDARLKRTINDNTYTYCLNGLAQINNQ